MDRDVLMLQVGFQSYRSFYISNREVHRQWSSTAFEILMDTVARIQYWLAPTAVYSRSSLVNGQTFVNLSELKDKTRVSFDDKSRRP